MVIVRRALLSCYDKTGLDVFANALAELGVELVASGGTAEFLAKRGLRVKTVEEFAGITEQLDGRVKTLHPKIHAGILARRDEPTHLQAAGAGGLIDLVAVNLYPFQETVEHRGASLAEAVEQIDIGGVALLRAAAKNFAHVAAVCRPAQYPEILKVLRDGKGTLPVALSQRLATDAFASTSVYDTRISGYLSQASGPAVSMGDRPWPDGLTVNVRKRQELRYGENPHQRAAWYVPASDAAWGLGTLRQLQGKELSYNNLLDIDAALRILREFVEPSCAIIKHHSLCGLATAAAPSQAYERAFACDAESAFGGIVGLNRPVDAALARQAISMFLEVIMAPDVAAEALPVLATKPNLRVVTLTWPTAIPSGPEWRQLSGSWLVQEPDTPSGELPLTVVTKRSPSEQERRDLRFAWTAVQQAKSNAIVLARDGATVGIGQGQPSRVGSVRLAIAKAGERGRGAVAASDGFFPFPDSIGLLAAAGVTVVIQPGGSIRDREVIAAADAAGLAMGLTGVRHFRH